MNTEQAALVCKALGDANRMQIVQLLTGGELCACKLLEQFSITQPTLSHHMKILCDCGLVDSRRDGKWTYYSLNCTMFKEFKLFIGDVTCKKPATASAAYHSKESEKSCCCKK
jgi:ArsR family transcriptional regulator, arsenate/arsenite/antimonite-responsive transcriptional repressor